MLIGIRDIGPDNSAGRPGAPGRGAQPKRLGHQEMRPDARDLEFLAFDAGSRRARRTRRAPVRALHHTRAAPRSRAWRLRAPRAPCVPRPRPRSAARVAIPRTRQSPSRGPAGVRPRPSRCRPRAPPRPHRAPRSGRSPGRPRSGYIDSSGGSSGRRTAIRSARPVAASTARTRRPPADASLTRAAAPSAAARGTRSAPAPLRSVRLPRWRSTTIRRAVSRPRPVPLADLLGREEGVEDPFARPRAARPGRRRRCRPRRSRRRGARRS